MRSVAGCVQPAASDRCSTRAATQPTVRPTATARPRDGKGIGGGFLEDIRSGHGRARQTEQEDRGYDTVVQPTLSVQQLTQAARDAVVADERDGRSQVHRHHDRG